MSRRPDIQHLPLTCENTNTAMPYIDLVNETLEYYVANGMTLQQSALEQYHGHDTGSTASEDLLANPQYVMDSAYQTLCDASFPAPLPFHQSLESMRRYFGKFEVPLALAMEKLRKNDDLDTAPYGWRDILMEEIGISRAEFSILTDSTRVSLSALYGSKHPSEADVVAELSNAKQFARRVNITYQELVSLLRARFINPNADMIPKLEKLGVTFAQLKILSGNPTTGQSWLDLLPGPLPDATEYGGDIEAWIKNPDNLNRAMSLLTLAIPYGTWNAWAPNRAYALGDCVRPTAPPPGSTLYYRCASAGASGATEPGPWPSVPGDVLTADGTVSWTCVDVSSTSSFDYLAFRYADPDKLGQNINAADFVRMMRFIRLWKKLGWTIEQTDAAICALYRPSVPPAHATDSFADLVSKTEYLDSGCVALIQNLGVAKRVMNALNSKVDRDLLSLLACWADIGTYGDASLYRQMFLNPAMLKQDNGFDDRGYGEFLTGTPLKLADHADALRAAFSLSGDEYSLIAEDLPVDPARIDRNPDSELLLTLRNISAIFRRGWLARKLKLSVRDLLLLAKLTGLDVFAAADPVNPAILRLVNLVQLMQDRSLTPAAALYLMWNQDISGKSAPGFAEVASLLRTLRTSLSTVEAEYSVVQDPDGTIAETRIAMVYGADAAAFFFSLVNDTFTVDSPFEDPDGTMRGATRAAIETAAGTAAGNPRLIYDDFRKRLLYTGILPDTIASAITNAAGSAAGAFNTAIAKLSAASRAAVNPFFARYPELKVAYYAYTHASGTAADKRATLLGTLLPEMVRIRKKQIALQSLGAAVKGDVSLAQTLLDSSPAPLRLHAIDSSEPKNPLVDPADAGDQGAVNDLLAATKVGLTVHFFAGDTVAGTAIPGTSIAESLNYYPATPTDAGNPLPANPAAGAPISGVWSGYVEASESGFFNIYVTADAGATVNLMLDGVQTLAADGTDSQLWRNRDPLQLVAGKLYSFALTVEKVMNMVRVEWDWSPKGQGRGVIPSRYLYTQAVVDRFEETYVRFLKAASLASTLRLAPTELAHFAAHPDYQINGDGWLNALPVRGDLPPGTAAALLRPLDALLRYARVKSELSPDDESLLEILNDPTTAAQQRDSLLFSVTKWSREDLHSLMDRFGIGDVGELAHWDSFMRIYDAFAIVRKMGVSAQALCAAVTNDPTAASARSLQAALCARYDVSAWRDVVRPLNDEMRGLQRDALVAYILHQMRTNPDSPHIDTPDKLFEYFLMDVQMEPGMQTSRIRHALSSVQLFIDRCLMNLEPRVSAGAINAKQWEWMKRYRIWEAQRKVYLYPENWLEPELRDDKSPFFKEIECELLQGDITEDSATTAYLNYLAKLEEVAKLEPCGIYCDEDNDVDHVVGRTAGAHRKYYYRRREGNSWTPWEQIKLEIEDNPITPVVWNGRLFLFWLRILQRGPDTPHKPTGRAADCNAADFPDPYVNVRAVLCWSEYFNGKWHGTKTSSIDNPAHLGYITGNRAYPRSQLYLSTLIDDSGALRVLVGGLQVPLGFVLYNTHSLPEWSGYVRVLNTRRENQEAVSPNDVLCLNYYYDGELRFQRNVIAGSVTPFVMTEPHQNLQHPWNAPFLLSDNRCAFYVTTEERPTWVSNYNGMFTPPLVTLGSILIPGTMPAVQPISAYSNGAASPVFPSIVIDPGAMYRAMSGAPNMKWRIGGTKSLNYGGMVISAAGAISRPQNAN
jgi:hypothetical protein